MFVTMGVQLSLITTSLIYLKKFNEKKNYNYKFNKYILLSIIIPIIVFMISSIVLDFLNIKYVSTEFKGIIFGIAILTTIVGSISEEIGWRGTLLPIFEKKYTPFISSLFVGLLWGAWHFFKISTVGILGYILFIPSIVMYSVLISYIYNKSSKSILNPIVFHSFINICSILLIYERECIEFYIISFVISIISIILLYLFDKNYFIIKK
jgi:membrane protease YdiL (CAAX protease family)